MIGVPYAEQVYDEENNVMYQVCPVCREGFALENKKDEDSRTGYSYANHYVDEHEGAVV